MQTGMIKTQIYLKKDQFNELKYSAAKNKVSYAELIRKAVDLYLQEEKPLKTKKVNWALRAKKAGVHMGGNVSQNIDEELYQ